MYNLNENWTYPSVIKCSIHLFVFPLSLYLYLLTDDRGIISSLEDFHHSIETCTFVVRKLTWEIGCVIKHCQMYSTVPHRVSYARNDQHSLHCTVSGHLNSLLLHKERFELQLTIPRIRSNTNQIFISHFHDLEFCKHAVGMCAEIENVWKDLKALIMTVTFYHRTVDL